MLPDAFTKALKNLLLPGILKLFLICLLAYVLGWLALSAGLGWLIGAWVGADSGGWFAGFLAGTGASVLAWFVFPLLFPILMSFFDEQMAEIIERQDYPGLPKATPPFWPTLWYDVKFTLKALALNLLCLPLYFVPLINVLVYYSLNGYLLGAQFFRMSAGRRESQGRTDELIRKHRNAIMLAGIAIVFFATIPILNLVAPVLGVATMLHLYHAANGAGRQEVLLPRE